MTIKIFIGNLSSDTQSDDIRVLFEKYGTVAECDVLKNFGFVHMSDKSEADSAIADLDGYMVNGQKMRVELSTGKKGNPKGDRRGPGGSGRGRPYPPGPPRDHGGYDHYDPYYRPPYPERDPYMRPLPPVDRYLPPRALPGDRYPPPPRDALLPEERRPYPPDPRDRLMPPRERLPLYPEERSAYDRLRAAERTPMASDPYYRERSPPGARPPPEYYERKPPMSGRAPPPADSGAGRLNTTAYPPANGYDYYRQPAERTDYRQPAGQASDYYAGSRSAGGLYDRAAPASSYDRNSAGGYGRFPAQGAQSNGGYGVQEQQSKSYDSQVSLQTKPIFF